LLCPGHLATLISGCAARDAAVECASSAVLEALRTPLALSGGHLPQTLVQLQDAALLGVVLDLGGSALGWVVDLSVAVVVLTVPADLVDRTQVRNAVQTAALTLGGSIRTDSGLAAVAGDAGFRIALIGRPVAVVVESVAFFARAGMNRGITAITIIVVGHVSIGRITGSHRTQRIAVSISIFIDKVRMNHPLVHTTITVVVNVIAQF